MGDNEPESQSLSLQDWRQHSGQGSCQHLARKDLWIQVGSRADEVLSPVGQSLQWPVPREISVVWSGPLVCGAQLSQQWSGACLSYTLRVVYSTLLGLLDKCLGTPDTNWGICPGAYLWMALLCRHGCSDHMCRYLRHVCLLDRCIFSDLGNFPLEPKCDGWLTVISVDMSDATFFFYILYAILIGPVPFYWSCSPQKPLRSSSPHLIGWYSVSASCVITEPTVVVKGEQCADQLMPIIVHLELCVCVQLFPQMGLLD